MRVGRKQAAKLDAFIRKVKTKNVKEWSNPDHLAAVASRAMVQLIKQKPAVGWVRADRVSTQEAEGEIKDLKLQVSERDKQITELQDLVASSKAAAGTPEGFLSEIAPITRQVFSIAGYSDDEFLDFVEIATGFLVASSGFVAVGRLVDVLQQRWQPKASSDPSFVGDAVLFLAKDKVFSIDGDFEIGSSSPSIRKALSDTRLYRRMQNRPAG